MMMYWKTQGERSMKLLSAEIIVSSGMDKLVLHTDLVTGEGAQVDFLAFLPKGSAFAFFKLNFSELPMKITRTQEKRT
jgi:hypothetical protein